MALLDELLGRGFRGRDPYDGLSCRALAPLARRSLLWGRLTTQLVKRAPLHLQAVLLAPAGLSATTLGYAMQAFARLERAGALPREWLPHVERLVAETMGLAVVNSIQEIGWGSHVDVATRFGFTPKTEANVVVTSCVARGLGELVSVGLVEEQDALRRIAAFVVGRLGRRAKDGLRWFAYTPAGDLMIHNGSMLASGTLARIGALTGDRRLIDEALAAAMTAIRYQRPDGSWPYAEHASGRWVDSFHTGFMLDGLAVTHSETEDQSVLMALQLGVQYYLRTLFGPAGEPWYSGDEHYPLDAMSAAEALDLLPDLAEAFPMCDVTYRRVLAWSRRNLLSSKGRVAYRVHRHWVDWRQFPRWSVAPMAAALAGASSVALDYRKDTEDVAPH